MNLIERCGEECAADFDKACSMDCSLATGHLGLVGDYKMAEARTLEGWGRAVQNHVYQGWAHTVE